MDDFYVGCAIVALFLAGVFVFMRYVPKLIAWGQGKS